MDRLFEYEKARNSNPSNVSGTLEEIKENNPEAFKDILDSVGLAENEVIAKKTNINYYLDTQKFDSTKLPTDNAFTYNDKLFVSLDLLEQMLPNSITNKDSSSISFESAHPKSIDIKENMIEVFYDVKDIVINGTSKLPTDDKAFLYNGSVYVPLNYISKNLG